MDVVEAVEAMLDQHVSFSRIEDWIEGRRDLESDDKSALWLYAWAETDRPQRRQAVKQLVDNQRGRRRSSSLRRRPG